MIRGLTRRPDALFAGRDYRLWWLGNVVSSTGNQFALIAMPLMVLLITGSSFQAGLVASCEALPYIVLGLPFGVIVDRLPRKWLMIGASLLSLVAFGTVPVAYAAHALSSGYLYLVAVINGCATVCFSVSQQASLPAVVDARHIGQATGQAETIERLAAILGPPIAALLFQNLWPAAPFVVDAATFAVIALAIWRIRADLGPDPAERADTPDGLLAGARSLWAHRLLRDLTLVNSAGDLLFAGIGLLMIILVRDAGQNGVSIGMVFSMAAIGGAIGSLVAQRAERRLGVATAVIGKHILTAALFPLLLLHLSAYGIGLVWAAISFQVSVIGVIQRKYVLSVTPAGLLGRVNSFVMFLSFGSLPVGTAATGFLLASLGARRTVLIYTAVLAALALWTLASTPIRTATRQREPAGPVTEPISQGR